MRITLKLDEDLAKRLRALAGAGGRSVDDVALDLIRRGLRPDTRGSTGTTPFRVQPHSCGWRRDSTARSLHQVVDDLDIQDFLDG